MANKQLAINEARKLYSQGHAIDEITRVTGHTYHTVRKYLKEECSSNNGHYDCRMAGKLAPYEQDVIEMRSQGITYKKIHEYICHKGYTGTIASLRVFMQKEITHQKSITAAEQTGAVEYIPRKCLCQLIYRDLENVKGMTQEQYEATITKYPVIGQLYTLLREFHRLIFSQKENELDSWMTAAADLQIEELDTYINGLKADIDAVKNGIHYKYNNGLAEGKCQ
ncbi:MAG: transposase [Lachnospiraceae bacterium]